MNATEQKQRYGLTVSGLTGAQIVSNPQVVLEAAASRWVSVRVLAPYDAATAGSHPITFTVTGQGAAPEAVNEKSVFLVPR